MTTPLKPPAFLPQPAQRLALAGVLLALLLLASLVSVLKDSVAQAHSKQQISEARAQERGRCNGLQNRVARGQCLLDLRLGEAAGTQLAQR